MRDQLFDGQCYAARYRIADAQFVHAWPYHLLVVFWPSGESEYTLFFIPNCQFYSTMTCILLTILGYSNEFQGQIEETYQLHGR